MKPKLNVDLQQSGPKGKVSTPRLRRYLYEMGGLTHTFETFADLAAWLSRFAANHTNIAGSKKTIRDARYHEGYAAGLREAAEIVNSLKVNPDVLVAELTENERYAIDCWRRGEMVMVSKTTTLGELLKEDL
jgi:hypothetical protein